MKKEILYNVPDCKSIAEIVESSANLFPTNEAFVERVGDECVATTFGQVRKYVKCFSAYMCHKGLGGKRVAIIGHNCKEWAMTYLTVLWGVGVVVPLDRDLQTDELKNLIEISKINAIVYSEEQAEKVHDACGSRHIKKFQMEKFAEYCDEGEALLDASDGTEELRHINDPYEMGILLFTSGTTGVAKGVMLSQYNIAANLYSVCRKTAILSTDRVLSVLPLHHTFESMSGFMSIFYNGGCIAYNKSLRHLMSDLQFYQPTVIIAVPLVFETFHKKIVANYAKQTGGKAVLALSRGIIKFTGNIASKQVFKAVRDALGGNIRAILCGAAALKPNVFRDFEKFGFLVYNGYGLTETAPVCIMHNDEYRCADDIGYPILDVEAKIINPNSDGAGELCVKGPNIMLGYYNDPEATAEVIDEDGWFHTGDLAVQRPNGAYAIVGRCKSMIVLDGGKKVFPEEIEHYLDLSEYISESLVFGHVFEEGGTQVCATIIPNYDAVNKVLAKSGITPEDDDYDKKVKEKITEEVTKACKKLPYFKVVRHVFIRKDDFVKTTTRKIKRFEKDNLKEAEEQ